MDEKGEWRKFWEEEYSVTRRAADRRLSDAMEVRMYTSWSRGRGRPRRRWPRTVILIRLKGESRWWFWDTDRRPPKIRWEVLANEIFGEDFCEGLSARGIRPEDYLRQEILRMAKEKK